MDKISKEPVRVVCVGGGHCNCLVMRLLKASLPENVKLTLVSESPMSYYSGMLPGASSSKLLVHNLYRTIHELGYHGDARATCYVVQRRLRSEAREASESELEQAHFRG
jgi:NADH dehydrogenase FAD-containing subunit